MANTALFIGWGEVRSGRESQAFELYGHALGYWKKQLAEKKIERLEQVLLQPHGGELAGFYLIEGEQAKLDELRHSDEFRDIASRSVLCLHRFGVVSAHVGEGVQKVMSTWQKNIPR